MNLDVVGGSHVHFADGAVSTSRHHELAISHPVAHAAGNYGGDRVSVKLVVIAEVTDTVIPTLLPLLLSVSHDC